jgi:hypothetical protein
VANKTVIISTPVPFSTDRAEIPVKYIDINGDESEFAIASFETNPDAGGSSGGSSGTAHTDGTIVGDTPVTLVIENLTRKSLLLINNSDTDAVYIKAGGGVTADYHSIRIAAGKSYTTDSTGEAYEAVCATGLSVEVTIEEIATTWPGGI